MISLSGPWCRIGTQLRQFLFLNADNFQITPKMGETGTKTNLSETWHLVGRRFALIQIEKPLSNYRIQVNKPRSFSINATRDLGPLPSHLAYFLNSAASFSMRKLN